MKRLQQVLLFGILPLDRLIFDAGDVVIQRYRACSVVGAVGQVIASDRAARFGQDVDVVVGRGGALVGDVLLHLQSRQHRLDHPERQLDLFGDLAAFCFAEILQVAIDDCLEQAFH